MKQTLKLSEFSFATLWEPRHVCRGTSCLVQFAAATFTVSVGHGGSTLMRT
jgi:hypothetical protein